MKETKDLELRMYFLVPYNISDIQKGIQAGHAALEYAAVHGNTKLFKDFVKNWKTWIILNGGTTNNNMENRGTIQQSFHYIIDNDYNDEIRLAIFNEPDLNDAITSFCFIADERVFNFTDYPDFKDWAYGGLMMSYNDRQQIKKLTIEEQKEKFPEKYEQWVNVVLGGWTNEILRNVIREKRLA